MRKAIFIFIISVLLLHAKCVAQNNTVYGAGISYTNGVPTFVPPSKSARVAIDTVTSKWYEYATPGGWRWSGDRVQDISGCAAPAYTPGKAQSRLVLNNCTEAQNGHGPELYKYTGSAWLCLNCGGNYTAGDGIDITGSVITNTAPDQVVGITGAGINAITGTYPNFTVTGTEVDGSVTNELQTLSISGDTISLSDGGGSVVVPSVVGSSYVYDNYRLPGIYQTQPGWGLNANESVTNYGFGSVDNVFYRFSTTPMGSATTEYGGWLANGTTGDSIAVSAPFWVIFGDSQAEGHPFEHGRLHVGNVAGFTVNYQDNYGTIGYTLNQLTGMRWINHGIGSQNFPDLIARIGRDVLNQTVNVGDGRGSKTLQRKPNGCLVICGINDITQGKTIAEISANAEKVAQILRDNKISAVFLNCPGLESATQLQLRKIDSLNQFFASGALQSYGAAVVDYNRWWRDPSFGDNVHGNSLIYDDVHPSRVGYDSLANYIFRAAKLPVLRGAYISTAISPSGFSGYSRPIDITIQGKPYTLTNTEYQFLPISGQKFAWDSVWIKIVSSTSVTGTSYTGFNQIEWVFSNDTSNLVTKRNPYFSGYNASASNWMRTLRVLTPANLTDQVVIGANAANTAKTLLTIKSPLNTGNEIVSIKNSTGAIMFQIYDNNRVSVGGSYLGGDPFSCTGVARFGAAASPSADYTYINGSQYNFFGPTIYQLLQSTAVNTGGTGRTDLQISWNGNELSYRPSTAAAGKDVPIKYINKAGDYAFSIDLATKRLGNANNLYFGVDFSGSTDGLNMPRGTTAQRGASGNSLNAIRYNTDSLKYEAKFANGIDYHAIVTTPSYAPSVGQILIWDGVKWVASNNTMTTTARNALTVGKGVNVFCTDCAATDGSTGVMQTWNGTVWKNHW